MLVMPPRLTKLLRRQNVQLRLLKPLHMDPAPGPLPGHLQERVSDPDHPLAPFISPSLPAGGVFGVFLCRFCRKAGG